MAHANPKHSNQSPSNAQLKIALSLIAAEIARGPMRSSSLSKIMHDTFGGSDASGAWNWRMELAHGLRHDAGRCGSNAFLGCERVRSTW